MKTNDFIKKVIVRDCRELLGRNLQVSVDVVGDGYEVKIIDYTIGGTLIDFIKDNYSKIVIVYPYSEFRVCLTFVLKQCIRD